MAALTTQNIVDAGTEPSFGAVSASDTFEIGNGLNTFVVYKNSGVAAIEVTFIAPGTTSYGVELPDNQVEVPAGGGAWVPVRTAYRGDGAVATVTTASETAGDLTVAVVRLG